MTTSEPHRASGGLHFAILAAFFMSGAAGLVHEVAWTRLLRLVMGNTTLAISTVLTVFMAGLALGSFLSGRLIGRRTDPVRIFALIEGVIGIYCLVLPALVDIAHPIYRAAYGAAGGSLFAVSLARFGVSALLLAVPATLMGATLPILVHFFAQRSRRVGLSVGTLYATNTLGAFGGTVVAGFVLLPSFGVRATIATASAMNLVVCAAGLALHRATERATGRATERAAEAPAVRRSTERAPDMAVREALSDRAFRLLLLGYGASGFAALLYEVAWTRILSSMIGSTVYGFCMMLSAFILGLGVGALVCARLVDRLRRPVWVLAWVQVGVAASCLAVVPLFDVLPLYLPGIILRSSGSFLALQATEFALLVAIMLVPTTLMGASFALVSRISIRGAEGSARRVGTVYSANTVGTILGSFTCGFLLIPFLGTQNAILVGVLTNALAGAGFFLLVPHPASGRPLALGSVLLLALGAWSMPAWNPSRMSLGPFLQAYRNPAAAEDPNILRAMVEQETESGGVLFFKEGRDTTIAVRRDALGELSLWVNGKPDASSASDLPTQLLLTHVPMLMHPRPERMLMVGLASGISLGAAGLYPLEALDCAEISDAVVEASDFFRPFNRDILDDPRVRIIVEDGRTYLNLTRNRYDVIVSEPSNPWIAGIADLFTTEFFEICRARLNEGGIACVWLEWYTLDAESFQSVVRSFHEVFPNMTVWNSLGGDFMLVGVRGELSVDLEVLEDRLADAPVAQDLERIGVRSAEDFFSHFLTGSAGARRLGRGAPLHTDDSAALEFRGPRSMAWRKDEGALVDLVESCRDPDLSFLTGSDAARLKEVRESGGRAIQASGLAQRGKALFGQGRSDEALAAARLAFELHPTNRFLDAQLDLGFEFARRFLQQPEDVEARIELYLALLAIGPARAREQTELARDLLGLSRINPAIDHLTLALEHDPDLVEALDLLAWVHVSQPGPRRFNPQRALELAQRAAQRTERQRPEILRTLSIAEATLGRVDDAIATAQEALALAREMEHGDLVGELESLLANYR